MNVSRMRRAVLASAASALLLAGCSDANKTAANPGEAASGTCKGESFRIAKASPSFVYLPFYVAEGGKFFEHEGLVPETVEVHTGAGIVAAAVSGSVDVAMVTAGEVYVASAEGAPVQAFAQVSNLGTNIVAKQSLLDERGITAESTDEERLALLKGSRIAVTGSGSGTDQLIRYMAKAGGFDPDKDMEIIATGSGGNSVSGFTSGRFDIIAISSPQSDIAIREGQGAYLFDIAHGDYKPLADNLYITAMASERTIAQRPAMLECLTAALGDALELIQNDPGKSAELARPLMGNIDPEIFSAAFESNRPSWPATPAINRDNAESALDFQNKFLAEPLSADVLDAAINPEIAEAAKK
ncbi:ABC transporter substrate-binding protein [Mycolicibacterium litorale]|uniref:ABC transporter substrate-binding protein n=1 Tax=Mycolicibacterium litorale TaxID=758802 RepID=UPI003CFB5DF9